MGNLSSGRDVKGVPRRLVRMAGYRLHGTICLPAAHPHALWLLAMVEALLTGSSPAQLLETPPWPVPPDALISRQLLNTLMDLGWARPRWASGGMWMAPNLAAAFDTQGREGLAKQLFESELVAGEWWMDGLGGLILPWRVASQFDWDFSRRANEVLESTAEPISLLDENPPELGDLLQKIRGVDKLFAGRDGAFLAGPLRVVESKYILFPLFGSGALLLPDELADLVPVLQRHRPDLLGERSGGRSRVTRLLSNPVLAIDGVLSRLPSNPTHRGSRGAVEATVKGLAAQIEAKQAALVRWIDEGSLVHCVVGTADRHFDALFEACAKLKGPAPLILLTSAFINPNNLDPECGLIPSLASAPPDARLLLIYGHANDDTPSRQLQDINRWLTRLSELAPDLHARVTLVPSKRRSHEKVCLASDGWWMMGSWNPASAMAGSTVFECSLTGREPDFARAILDRLKDNVDDDTGVQFMESMSLILDGQPAPRPQHGEGAIVVKRLQRATALLLDLAEADEQTASAGWEMTIRAVRAAFMPLTRTCHMEIVDEHQTRDTFVALSRAAQGHVLLASDRLADSALDGSMLRDLRGESHRRRHVRVVWGREWEGQGSLEPQRRRKLQRARHAVGQARQVLGGHLHTRDTPMENHAKLLVVDGVRGLVTSENILSYGGEKGRYESRELGLRVEGPALLREVQGAFLNRWPGSLSADRAGRGDAPLAWARAASEAWYALACLPDLSPIGWRVPGFLGEVVLDELSTRARSKEPEDLAALEALGRLTERLGDDTFLWVKEHAERLGLCWPTEDASWLPWTETGPDIDVLLKKAEAKQPSRQQVSHLPGPRAGEGVHPVVKRIQETLVELEPGTFWMGEDRVPDEGPRHRVKLTRPFRMANVPVEQAIWKGVMGGLPHLRDVQANPEYPVIQVSYKEMQDFLRQLNRLPGARGFDLPTEAQWEYACRAGSDSAYCFGDNPGRGRGSGELERYAWTKRNAEGRLQRVGGLKANAFGLYDMHGLVYETMKDGHRTFERGTVVDPVGPMGSGRIVARGGCWGRFPVNGRGEPLEEHFRSASRQVHEPSHRVGFRLIQHLEEG